jgi:hypothetical protein
MTNRTKAGIQAPHSIHPQTTIARINRTVDKAFGTFQGLLERVEEFCVAFMESLVEQHRSDHSCRKKQFRIQRDHLV